MTRTEERLADALRASADRVQDNKLRPLRAPEREVAHRQAWRGWLVPAAAAASVALIIGLAVAVTGGTRHAHSGPSSASGTSGFPKYFAQFRFGVRPGPTLEVRSTSTGSLVASAPFPKEQGWTLALNTVAASPDGRTFYVDYDADRPGKPSVISQIWIYRLSITPSGQATPLTKVNGGQINGAAALGHGGSMAVSPDGTKLALTADTTTELDPNSRGWADKIIVIDLRTGARTVWQGGLYRPGKVFTIPDISWTADGRSLVFLGLWCNPPAVTNLCAGTSGQQGYRDTQIRSLRVASGGGALDRSVLLLTQSARYPVIAAAVAGPGAAELTVIVLSGHPGSFGTWSKVAVERVSAAGGALLGIEYRSAATGGEGQPIGVAIRPDPSGRYQLFSYRGPGGFYTGWIGGGKLHFLPIKQPYPGMPITAW